MQQKNKKIISAMFYIVAAICTISCKKQNASLALVDKVETDSKQIRIGFSIDTLALERWQRDLDVFMNRAKELGADVIVQNAGNSVEEQKKQLLYLMEKKVNAVVILAKNKDSLSETIQKLRAKNIPVISYDRLISNADISMYISVNTERVGELMARKLLASQSGSSWYCILGPDEDYNMTLIKKGISKALLGSPARITNIFYTEGWNYDLAYQEAVNIFTSSKLPDAIICGNDALAVSVIKALLDYSPERRIPICGQDADIAACQNIVEGLQSFTIYKPITNLASSAAEYAVQLAKGKDVKELVSNGDVINNGFADIPVVWFEPQVVTKDNMDSIIIDSGFHTHAEVYRNNGSIKN